MFLIELFLFHLSFAGDSPDINECDVSDPCTGELQRCLNTIGSFECVCVDGYELLDSQCQGSMADHRAVLVKNQAYIKECQDRRS